MWPIVLGFLGWQARVWSVEMADRRAMHDQARAYCDSVGKPLLNIGCPATRPLGYPCGDVCLELAPARLAGCRAARPVLGDVRDLSAFGRKAFGACLCFHVLEHLPTIGDAQQAIAEMGRVADRVYVCSPSRTYLVPWIHPDHHLWVDHGADGTIRLEQRNRGEQHGEIGYGLIKELWAIGEATMATVRTGAPFDRTLRAERAKLKEPGQLLGRPDFRQEW